MSVRYLKSTCCSTGQGNIEPVSIPTLVKRNAREVPDYPAMKQKDPKTGEEVRHKKTIHQQPRSYLPQRWCGLVRSMWVKTDMGKNPPLAPPTLPLSAVCPVQCST